MKFASHPQHDAQIGTFVKTPHPHIIEVLSLTSLDFLILDAEHAPFDRSSLDLCLMAAKLSQTPALVRVPDSHPSTLLNALDCGASGVLVPHVCSAKQAQEIVKRSHFGAGGRGYAGSTRAADYTNKTLPEHLSSSAENTRVIVQIEDIEGVENVEQIAAAEGVDALFIGQVDLAVAYGTQSVHNDTVLQASKRIIAAAQQHQKPVGMFVADASQIRDWKYLGVSFFGVASEHKMILDGFKQQRLSMGQNT